MNSTKDQRVEARRGAAGFVSRLDTRTFPKGDSFSFTSGTGNLNVVGTPPGTNGYSDLVGAAAPHDFDGARVLVASIDDQIRMARAAGRDKDRLNLEQLGALRDHQDHPNS